MSHVKNHWEETRNLVRKLDSIKVAKWLLEEGYFPEEYVLPPNFRVTSFPLLEKPNFKVSLGKQHKFTPNIPKSTLTTISFPKTDLTERVFGIYTPEIYHDIVWYIEKNWGQIVNHLFNNRNKVYSYSFPIPVSSSSEEIPTLRSGRMIYEYLELAEKDLLADSYKYKYLLKTDIKNFYPSIYTHSISWALHTKEKIRMDNERNLRYIGNVLDRLVSYSNDRKTNGLPIGPAISDLIAEIVLAGIDLSFSKRFRSMNFLAARYKDDYFFLLKSKEDAQSILNNLQTVFSEYNLFLNEEKTEIRDLPIGLLRPWNKEFEVLWSSMVGSSILIPISKFIILCQEVMDLQIRYPNSSIIEKFLSKIINYSPYDLLIDFNQFEDVQKSIHRVFSLIMHMGKISKKAFPNVLAVIEVMFRSDRVARDTLIMNSLLEEIKNFSREVKNSGSLHQKLWWVYFVLSNSIIRKNVNVSEIYGDDSSLLNSFKKGKQKFYSEFDKANLFVQPSDNEDLPIAKYLDLFNK